MLGNIGIVYDERYFIRVVDGLCFDDCFDWLVVIAGVLGWEGWWDSVGEYAVINLLRLYVREWGEEGVWIYDE